MDVSPDVWGQLALEASQVYLTDGTAAKSPFANTVFTEFPIKPIFVYYFITELHFLDDRKTAR